MLNTLSADTILAEVFVIIVITTKERNPRTGREQVVVSHGIDMDTDRTVILPCEPPEALGAVFNPEMGEYVLSN